MVDNAFAGLVLVPAAPVGREGEVTSVVDMVAGPVLVLLVLVLVLAPNNNTLLRE